MSKWLIHAPSEFVGEMISQLLRQGGVTCTFVGGPKPSSLAGGRDIYVDDGDLARAREILRTREVASVDEQDTGDDPDE